MNLSELKVPIEKLFIDYIIDLVRKIEALEDRIKVLESNNNITVNCSRNVDIEQIAKELEFYRKSNIKGSECNGNE